MLPAETNRYNYNSGYLDLTGHAEKHPFNGRYLNSVIKYLNGSVM